MERLLNLLGDMLADGRLTPDDYLLICSEIAKYLIDRKNG